MSSLHHIRLTLAREPGHPEGDAGAGYDIMAFLDADGRLDLAACRQEGARCHVRRFEHDETASTGRLRHTTGDRWILDFDGGDQADVTGFRLGDERFVAGEYVSLVDQNGASHPYLVDRVGVV